MKGFVMKGSVAKNSTMEGLFDERLYNVFGVRFAPIISQYITAMIGCQALSPKRVRFKFIIPFSR